MEKLIHSLTEQKIDVISDNQTAAWQKQLRNFDTVSYRDSYHLNKFTKQSKDVGMKNLCQVASSDRNRTWRLIQVIDDNNAEEVVLRIQGIICSKTLPPINHPFRV
jgi:hypothetical protein